MPAPDPRIELVGRWLGKAAADAGAATALLRERGWTEPWTACFHAQQAAEKCVKAVLVATGIEPPYVHNLVALKALAPPGWSPGVSDEDLGLLTTYAAAPRYAFAELEAEEDPSWTDAEGAVALALVVEDSTRAWLRANGFDVPMRRP